MSFFIPNSTQVPNIVLDYLMGRLPTSEFKCLLYINRRTFGFNKYHDLIPLSQFINGIKNQKFGFFDDLKGLMEKKGIKIEHSILQGKYGQIIEYLLLPKGLNYLNLPKALIPFHKYKKYSRTFLEEHLIEGMAYSKDNSNCVHIHFTVSSEFKQKITDFTHSILHKFNKEPVTFNIQFSEQKTSTNTIAVDGNNNPFRDKSSKLVLRPGGHGALIKNINTLEGDIIFIKNIDNVVPDTLKEETIKFKKILGVILINIQSEVFKSLKRLTSGKMTEEEIKMF